MNKKHIRAGKVQTMKYAKFQAYVKALEEEHGAIKIAMEYRRGILQKMAMLLPWKLRGVSSNDLRDLMWKGHWRLKEIEKELGYVPSIMD